MQFPARLAFPQDSPDLCYEAYARVAVFLFSVFSAFLLSAAHTFSVSQECGIFSHLVPNAIFSS